MSLTRYRESDGIYPSGEWLQDTAAFFKFLSFTYKKLHKGAVSLAIRPLKSMRMIVEPYTMLLRA